MDRHRVIEAPLSETEFAVLKRLIHEGAGPIGDVKVEASMLQHGFIRADVTGWAITVRGHMRYVRELANRF